MPKIDAPTLVEHHAQRRAAILSTATQLLLREGAGAVTPAAVAGGSGLARSSVYQYYPSTGALLGAAIEETFVRAQRVVDAAVAAAGTPQQQVAAYLDAALGLAIDGHGPMGPLASVDTPVPPECAERVVVLHDALVAPLTEALAASGVADPAQAAAFINGVVGAAAALVARGRALEEVRRDLHRFTTRGLYGIEAPTE